MAWLKAATQEPMSPTTGATISMLESISFGSMSTWMNFFGASPQPLPFPMHHQPVKPGPDQHPTVEILQHGGAGRTGALRMGVRQQALGHAHGQERHAALLDEVFDFLVGLCVGRAL